MRAMFLLQHVHEFKDGDEDVKLIGVFSSEAVARDTQRQIKRQPGFRELPEGFDILSIESTASLAGRKVRFQADV